MPGTFLSMSSRLSTPRVSSICRMTKDLALRIERPDVGASGSIPAGRGPNSVPPWSARRRESRRRVVRGVLEPRIAAGARPRYTASSTVDDMRPDDTVGSRDRGPAWPGTAPSRRRSPECAPSASRPAPPMPAFAICAAVEHVLQAIAQRRGCPRVVLHLEHDSRRISRSPSRWRNSTSAGAKSTSARLARFERADDAIEPRYFSHPWSPDR